MNVTDFKVGERVQFHPATDFWMRGRRYGTVESLGTTYVSVMSDDGRLLKVYPHNLLHLEDDK